MPPQTLRHTQTQSLRELAHEEGHHLCFRPASEAPQAPLWPAAAIVCEGSSPNIFKWCHNKYAHSQAVFLDQASSTRSVPSGLSEHLCESTTETAFFAGDGRCFPVESGLSKTLLSGRGGSSATLCGEFLWSPLNSPNLLLPGLQELTSRMLSPPLHEKRLNATAHPLRNCLSRDPEYLYEFSLTGLT